MPGVQCSSFLLPFQPTAPTQPWRRGHIALEQTCSNLSPLHLFLKPVPWCHLVKAKLLHLKVCFSCAVTQCISHVMLTTVEGKKSRQVQKSKEKAMTRQWHEWDKGTHKRGINLRQTKSRLIWHLTHESVTPCAEILTDRRLGAVGAERQISTSCRWQLLVSQIKCVSFVPRCLGCSNQSHFQRNLLGRLTVSPLSFEV